MITNPRSSSEPSSLAVVHRVGDTWRVLVAEYQDSRPTIRATREFPADQTDQVNGWLNQQGAASVVCVLPSSSVICRTCPLPNVPAGDLDNAVRLQAEAYLQDVAPSHRQAWAVVPKAAHETTRCGLVLAWPESSDFTPLALSRPQTFVPEIAALAALVNDQRPSEPAMWLDRTNGSIALAMAHPEGMMFRSTREDHEGAEQWRKQVARTVVETALNVGLNGSLVQTWAKTAQGQASSLGERQGRLFIPMESLAGLFTIWWMDYGVAVGALLARAGELKRLTDLQYAPTVAGPSRVMTTLSALSKPAFMARVAAVCLLILMLGPLLFSGLRLAVLSLRFGSVEEQLEEANAARHRLEMYRELQKQDAWPMTKLLADITTNTPIGIELESIRIEAGKDFAVSGTAIAHENVSPTELVGLMEKNLRADGLFSDVNVNWGSGNNFGMYKFDLSAKVTRPYHAPDYPVERDFAALPYRTRLYGEDDSDVAATGSPGQGAASPATSGTASTTELALHTPSEQRGVEEADGSAPRDGGRSLPSPVRSRANPSGRVDFDDPTKAGGTNSVVARSRDIPPPLTEKEIEAMSLAELNQAWVRVAEALQYSRTDDEIKDRLKNEFRMIRDQVKKVKGS